MRTLFTFVFFCVNITSFKSKSEPKTHVETAVASNKIISSDEDISKYLVIELNPKNNSRVFGKVPFVQSGNNVVMTALVSGLFKGMHAIHIHQKSDCSSNDGKSTGGHWNPTAQPHGKWGSETGYHKVDIGNFIVGDKKTTKIKFTTDQWCMGCWDETKDILGKGLIIHQGIDDFVSQPSGTAGSRVSCAGIIE